MKISIVIVSYNQAAFLEDTILSVLNQEYSNKEVILIDGGSTDSSLQIIKKYADKFTYWVSEPDKGQTDAIVKGFSKCTGEIISWINSDDLLEDNVLNVVALKADTVKTVNGIFYGKCLIIDENGKKQDISVHEKFNYYISKKLGPCISQPGTFWGRDAYIAVGGLNTKLQYGMDLDLFNNFMFSGYPFYYTSKIHARFRRYSNQKGHSKEFLEKCNIETTQLNKKYNFTTISRQTKIMARIAQVFLRIVNGYYIKTLAFRYNQRRSLSEYNSTYSD